MHASTTSLKEMKTRTLVKPLPKGKSMKVNSHGVNQKKEKGKRNDLYLFFA